MIYCSNILWRSVPPVIQSGATSLFARQRPKLLGGQVVSMPMEARCARQRLQVNQKITEDRIISHPYHTPLKTRRKNDHQPTIDLYQLSGFESAFWSF